DSSTPHRDEITTEESAPMMASSSSSSSGVLRRFWSTATSPFRGCISPQRKERDELKDENRRLKQENEEQATKIRRFESMRDSREEAAIRRLESRSAADCSHFSISSGISSTRSRRQSENNESVYSNDDSGHGEQPDGEGIDRRRFLDEIVEQRGKLKPVEKNLGQVLNEITKKRN
ncbi:hypothetical protein PMAYCL1PPCAC_20349, partial [Pristionchus mayeri]